MTTTYQQTFESLIDQHSDQDVILFNSQKWTHQEIHQSAAHVAFNLIRKGVQPKDCVAVMLDPGPQLITSILGILKSGAAFLPIDPKLPSERIQFVLENSQAKYCIMAEEGRSGIFIHVKELHQPAVIHELPSLDEDFPAYIIYTSGTTGRPKGVIISHRALYNYLQFAREHYLRSGKQDCIGLITSVAVDMTITSIFLPLISTCQLVIFNKGSNLQNLVAALNDPRITWLKCTPTHLSFITKETTRYSQLQTLIVGGEALPTSQAARIMHLFPGITLINEYGPTEATVGCTTFTFDEVLKLPFVPIGTPICGTSLLILDDHGLPAGKGEIGELLIGGVCLAEGYIDDPTTTSEKFIYVDGERHYKTGDLVKYENDNLHYMGRLDDQIKVNGYRVEPMEIASVLLTHPHIANALVIYEDKELHAFLQTNLLSIVDLVAFLEAKLPAWMVPSVFHIVEQWPASNNGKLDQAALKKSAKKLSDLRTIGKEGDLIDQITNYVLIHSRITNIKKEMNLFKAGMDSIELVIMIADLEQRYDCSINMGQVVKNPTIENIASLIIPKDVPSVFSGFNLQTTAAAPQIYCFPPALGGPLAFSSLISCSADIPYKVFESPSRLITPISTYSKAIRTEGMEPSILLGYSGGGNIAFEVGKALEAKNHPVKAIILLDSYRKKFIPEDTPDDISKMKEEALEAFGENISLSTIHDLNAYYHFINHQLKDYEGQVNIPVYLITSSNRMTFGNRLINQQPFFKSWDDCTRSTYYEIQGYGAHAQMLQGEYVAANFEIIEKIIETCRL